MLWPSSPDIADLQLLEAQWRLSNVWQESPLLQLHLFSPPPDSAEF
jgi:hypothetical protein